MTNTGKALGRDVCLAVEFRSNFGETSIFILMLIVIDPSVRAKDIAAIMGVTKRTIETYMSRLRKEGAIQRVGPDKGGYWEIRANNSINA